MVDAAICTLLFRKIVSMSPITLYDVSLHITLNFQKEYWTGEYEVEDDFLMTEKNDEKEKEVNDLVEEAGDAQPGVRIRSLTKTYDNGKTAVKNLSLKFYEGQITAFLGHNGAGIGSGCNNYLCA